MAQTNNVFAYRCARLNAYVQSYLEPKKLRYLLATGPVLQYLFNTQRFPDVVALISSNQFRWIAPGSPDVKQLMQHIQTLPNHSIFTSALILTAKEQIVTQNGLQVTEDEFNQLLKEENKPLSLQFELESSTELKALLAQVNETQIASDSDAIALPKGVTKQNVLNSLK